jgi:hypothetical protein
MRKYYFLFVLFYLFVIASCTQKQFVGKKEKEGLIFKAETGHWHKEDSFNYLSIKTTLFNNSPDTIRYVNMYCDSDIIYVIEAKKLNIHFRDCDKNSPETYILFPHQSKQSFLEGRTKADTSELIGEKFRVGFNYVKPESIAEVESKINFFDAHKNIIWSDTLTIKYFSSKQHQTFLFQNL